MAVWETIARELDRDGCPVLVTLLSADGSTPREAGARLVLTAQGFTGSIGGGTLEWKALARAQGLARSGCAALLRERMALGPALGQCCGGAVDVLYEAFDATALEAVRALAAAESAGAFVARGFVGETGVARTVVRAATAADPLLVAKGAALEERFGETPSPVLVFGAGHVGRALVLALAPLPFAVRWIDPRPNAFPAAMPQNATAVAPGDPLDEIDSAPDGAMIVVLTHSHALDYALVEAALAARRFAYVGVIGSATKRARFESRLREAGMDSHLISTLICPIGAAGPSSKLPAAIAASVAVELLVVREQAAAAALSPAAAARGRA
ncbi:MAG: xanthine dehydrogenase accessory protein XdhC [Hyphomicrobiales bacterium]